jgi:hypothetical protein
MVDYLNFRAMKPKYVFYLILLIAMHYEVGRLIESNAQQKDVDDSSYQRGAKLDTNERYYISGNEYKLVAVKLDDKHKKKNRPWRLIYKDH